MAIGAGGVHARRLLLDAAVEISVAPISESKAVAGGDEFDTNMVIILAALLCALICALGLNSIVRCALRCSDRWFSRETAEEAAARVAATTGMKKGQLRKIPVAVYGAAGVGNIPGTECAICLADFADGEKVRVLPKCNHGFHVGCIDRWLLAHSSCPNCRHSLLELKSVSSKAVGGGRRSENNSGHREGGGAVVVPVEAARES